MVLWIHISGASDCGWCWRETTSGCLPRHAGCGWRPPHGAELLSCGELPPRAMVGDSFAWTYKRILWLHPDIQKYWPGCDEDAGHHGRVSAPQGDIYVCLIINRIGETPGCFFTAWRDTWVLLWLLNTHRSWSRVWTLERTAPTHIWWHWLRPSWTITRGANGRHLSSQPKSAGVRYLLCQRHSRAFCNACLASASVC